MITCKRCTSQCAGTKEALTAMKNSCTEGVACNLLEWDASKLPSRTPQPPVEKRAVLLLPKKSTQMPLPARPPVTPIETMTIDIPDPLYILIKSSNRVKIINKE